MASFSHTWVCRPLLDLGMRLSEGTGAVLAMGLHGTQPPLASPIWPPSKRPVSPIKNRKLQPNRCIEKPAIGYRVPNHLPVAPRGTAPTASARAYFPLVGLALGGILAGLDFAAREALPPLVVGALLLLALLLLTRALHTEGFLDSCDGLFGGYTPERRLEILRDPHVGAFAVIGGHGPADFEMDSPGVHTRRCACRPPCCLPIHFPVRHAIHHVRVQVCPGAGSRYVVSSRSSLVAGWLWACHVPPWLPDCCLASLA